MAEEELDSDYVRIPESWLLPLLQEQELQVKDLERKSGGDNNIARARRFRSLRISELDYEASPEARSILDC